MKIDLEKIHVPRELSKKWILEPTGSSFGLALFFVGARDREDFLVRLAWATGPQRQVDRMVVWNALGEVLVGVRRDEFLAVVGDLEGVLDAIDVQYCLPPSSLAGDVDPEWESLVSWRRRLDIHPEVARTLREPLVGDVNAWTRYENSRVIWGASGALVRRWMATEEGFREFVRRRPKQVLELGAEDARTRAEIDIEMDGWISSGNQEILDNIRGWRSVFSLFPEGELACLYVEHPPIFVSWIVDWEWFSEMPSDLAWTVFNACPEERRRVLLGDPRPFFASLSNEQKAHILARGDPEIKQLVFRSLGDVERVETGGRVSNINHAG